MLRPRQTIHPIVVAGLGPATHEPRHRPCPLPWLAALLGRKHVNIAAAALANKNARIAWALLTRGQAHAGTRQVLSAAQ